MAHYLRDQKIQNIAVDIQAIERLFKVFSNRVIELNSKIPNEEDTSRKGILNGVIRFDEKGYRIFSFEELKQYFEQAKDIERIIITIDTGLSLQTNRALGTYMELRLDKKDGNTCFLTVTSDDRDWVDASYSAVQEAILKYKNRNGLARTWWTPFTVQLFGVFLIYVLCLWSAFKIAPSLKIENAFVMSFLFLLLILSNVWSYLNPQILRIINILFPNIRFIQANNQTMHWLFQAIVGSAVFAIIVYFMSVFGIFLFNFYKNLLITGA